MSAVSFVIFSFPFIFRRIFKRDVDRLPDVGRGEQIVCDKRIVGAEELFADRVLRDISFHSTDLQSGKSGRLGRWMVDRVLDL